MAQTPIEYRLSLISWNLTSACNLHCPHCYLSAGHHQREELTNKECLHIIDEMAALGTEMLILSGGEPLLRPDIFDLASYASENGPLVVMGSNDTLIDQKVASRLVLSRVKGIGISLDSLEPEKHDVFRGVKGAWQKSVAAIDVCQQQGLEAILQSTVLDWNYDEIPGLVDFAHRRQVNSIQFYYLVCTDRGEKLTNISPQQYEDSLSLLVDVQVAYPGIMVRARCAPHVRRIAGQKGPPLLGSSGCLAATSYMRIDPLGEVTPCPYFPKTAENVRQTGLKAIWEGATLFQKLRRPSLRGRCGSCDYGAVCIGCRARAYAITGDYLAEDPWCTYQPGNLPRPSLSPVEWSPEAEERLQRIPSFVRNMVIEASETKSIQAKAMVEFNKELDVELPKWIKGLQAKHKVEPEVRRITIYFHNEGETDKAPKLTSSAKGNGGGGTGNRKGFASKWGETVVIVDGVETTHKSPSNLMESLGLQVQGHRNMVDIFENPTKAGTKEELPKIYTVDAVKGSHFRVTV